jgi:hypothetical protein
MDRRSIVLLLTLAVLLQPVFASVCMMQCPPLAARQVGHQPMAGHATHTHHHVMTAACGESLGVSASGMCDKTVDLRSNALVAPTATPVFTTSEIIDLSLPLHVTSSSRLLDRADRFNAPIVVPLRI